MDIKWLNHFQYSFFLICINGFWNGSFACNNAKKMEFEWTFTEDLNGNEMKNGF